MRNKTPIIIGIVVLIALGLFGMTFLLPKISLPKPQEEANNEVETELSNLPVPVEKVITITEEGFSPVSMTVKVGEVVTFINESGTAAAVHSNPHPVHNLYREMNLGEFETGKTLGVILEAPGTYGYHNHLNPEQQGTILVVE